MAWEESELQKQIMVAVSPYAAIYRSPAGQYWQGRRVDQVLTDLRAVKVLCKGFPDLVGYRRSDGKAVFIEVKTRTGRVSKEQENFLKRAVSAGCLAGVARSEKDAIKIVTEGTGGKK